MLNLLRENLKSLSWVLWLVIIVFVGLVFMEIPQQQGPLGAGDAAAWAAEGDLEVTYREFERSYRSLEQQYRQVLGDNFSPQLAESIQQQALRNSIDEKILAAEARRVGLTVTDGELQELILANPDLKDENGNFIGVDNYRQLLRRNGYFGPDDYEGYLRDRILTDKLVQTLRASVYVSETDVEDAYRDQVERAKIRYITLPDAQFANDVQITPEDLQGYYEAHKEEYSLPEQRVVNYLLVDNVLLRNTLEVSEEDIAAYYNNNADQFREEEQVRARHILLRTDSRSEEEAKEEMAAIRARIEGGEDFATVAGEASEDPGSGARGGDLGLFPRGRMVPEFEEAAFNAPLNQLVGPIVSPFGVHLLEVTERREAGMQSLDDVRPRVQQIVLSEQLGSQSESRAQEVLARLKEAGDTATEERLKSLAEEFEFATFNQTVPFNRGDLIPGIGRSEEFAEAAFSLEEGSISDPVKVPRGWAILQLQEVKAPRLQELTEVEPQLRQAVRTEKQKEMAIARLEQAREEISAGKTLDAVAAELGLTAQESAEFGRSGGVPELADAGSTVAAQALNLEEGALGEVVQGSQGATLFEVTERKQWDPAEFEEQKSQIRDGVKQRKLGQLLASVVEQRRRELDVQMAPQLAEEMSPTNATASL